MQGVHERALEKFSRQRIGVSHQITGRAFGDHAAALLSRAGAEIDHVRGAPDGVLVVLDYDERVALGLQLFKGVEQDPVVARMQADGGFVQDIAHAAQVRSELWGEADALRLAAGERRRRAVERRVGEAHLGEERKARPQLGDDVARDLGFAAGELQAAEHRFEPSHGQRGELGDRALLVAHRERLAVEALAVASRAGLVDLQPFDPGVEHVVLGAGVRALLVPFHAVELEAGAVALGAPAMLGVEGEKPRIELGEAAPAGGAGALCGEGALREVQLHARRPGFRRSFGEAVESCDHVHHALAEFESLAKRPADFGFVVCGDAQVGDRQLERVLLKARQPRPLVGRQELAVHAQESVAAGSSPLGEVGVIALPVDDQRREQADALPLVFAQEARGDGGFALRLDRHPAVGAVLEPELDVEQSQEMIDLGERRDGALASPAAGALLDRDRGRDSEDRVHVGPRSAFPVCDLACFATSAGVPVQTTAPPASPPSGPRSTSQSQARMTSRLCSITTSECPAAINWRKAESSFATSSKCRPVVGSSKRNNDPSAPFGFEDASTRCPASFSRCASPPESVGTGGPTRRYSSPTSARGASAVSTACFKAAGTSGWPRKNASASETVSSSTSAIDFFFTTISSTSSRKRLPLQSGQRRYTSERNCISTCSKPLPPQVGQRPLPELKLKVPAVYLRSFASGSFA